MTEMRYVVVNVQKTELVRSQDIDRTKMLSVLENTIKPILTGGQAWANNRDSVFHVTGDVKKYSGQFTLRREGKKIASLSVCLHPSAKSREWAWIHKHGREPIKQQTSAPQPLWTALRYDINPEEQPSWLHEWAKHLGYALAMRGAR
ncbi:MAG: hypothetical protein Q8S02_09525 [Hydrogenophaga sp.]|nr:hypothetical protein [Hydrogenophaga sp.]